jgi:hypothetical protein
VTSPEYRASLRALSDAATPGPWWSTEVPEEERSIVWHHAPDRRVDSLGETDSWVDASFIVAAREAVPTLLDENDRLRGLLDKAVIRYPHTGCDNFDQMCANCGGPHADQDVARLTRENDLLRISLAAADDDRFATRDRIRELKSEVIELRDAVGRRLMDLVAEVEDLRAAYNAASALRPTHSHRALSWGDGNVEYVRWDDLRAALNTKAETSETDHA